MASSAPLFNSWTIPTRKLKLPLHSPLAASLSYQLNDSGFTWDDVVRFSPPHHTSDSSYLQGFFDKVNLCNRNAEKQREFVPFMIEEQTVGYVHNRFACYLRRFEDTFIFPEDTSYGGNFGYHLALHTRLNTYEDRTVAVANAIKCLGEEHIPGIRNELYPVISSFGTPEFFSLERAAAPYFGIKAYGVHMNGYVERDGAKYLWVAKRSKSKPTFPGKLDHMVAGGQPHGISCEENLVKECNEEAGIPRSISGTATAVGAVSYMDIDGYRFKRDVLFCYDLKLPEDFIPTNEDEEVESFKLVPVTQVASIIRSTDFFKANCNLVIIDFLFRHGYIKPEDIGYLKLLQNFGKVGVLGSNFRSSFCGKCSILIRDTGAASTRRTTVTSVLGKKVRKGTIIPEPDYRIPTVLLGAGGGFIVSNNLATAIPIGLLGLLLLIQEVKIGDQLEESGENVFVGGKNRWKYSTFVNWELWWPSFPILVYFKETQTKPEGQIHFFPVIFNGKQLYDVMVERCGPSKTSGPK
ncbi:nudix hydrolase 20, chloroplastic-like [Dorcoceras hygrometricum]|nr:nudix hydrolase 20, chloroplastic-like [Dorcoceras hygrometricum]